MGFKNKKKERKRREKGEKKMEEEKQEHPNLKVIIKVEFIYTWKYCDKCKDHVLIEFKIIIEKMINNKDN